MSVKIKISYNEESELVLVKKLLAPIMKSCNVSKNKEGRYKKAYAELKDLEGYFHCKDVMI